MANFIRQHIQKVLQKYIKNIYSTKEEVGSILKILLERLNKKIKR